MPLADRSVFTKEHIESIRFGTSTALAEQAIHCLELVAQLVKCGLNFQFKGGNSLLLIHDTPRRFSIDVDIATDEQRERIEHSLDTLVSLYGTFTKWTKRQHKTKPWIPIASYYLFYNSHYVAPEEAFVMLDVQLRRSPYKTEFKPVVCGNIYASDIRVELPLPASIIGDKLLTLGPNTLGIPVGKGKEAQRLKHVCDVSILLDMHPALEDIRKSFIGCMEHENSLQETAISQDAVLNDTLVFCASVVRYDSPPAVTEHMLPVLKENSVGIEPFAQHLFAEDYSWTNLQRDMARVALCITAVCMPDISHEMLMQALAGELKDGDSSVLKDSLLRCSGETRRIWACVAAWLGRNPLAE